MNDISPVRVQMPVTANAGKTMPAADHQAQGVTETAGNKLPPVADTKSAARVDKTEDVKETEQKAKEKADANELKVAVKTANEFVQTVQRDLHLVLMMKLIALL